MSTITKNDLVAELSHSLGSNSSEAATVVESFMEAVSRHLAVGNTIALRKFGTFELRPGGRRTARHPQQGGTEENTDRCMVRFRPGDDLKQRLAAIPPAAAQ